MALDAGLAFLRFARRLMPRLGEVLVAAPAAPALRYQNALARFRQVGYLLAGIFILNNRADGNGQDHVRPGMPGTVRALAVAAAVGFEFAIVAVAQQRVVVRIRFQVNAATMPAVAARGPASRHEFLPPKRNAAVSAVAGLHIDFRFVDKDHELVPPTEYDTGRLNCTSGSSASPYRSPERIFRS